MKNEMKGSARGIVEALPPILAGCRVVDLTHRLEEGMPTYPTHTRFFKNRWESMGDIANMSQLVLGEHTGTHVDSPSHFPISGPHRGEAISDLAPDALFGRCVSITLEPEPGPNELVSATSLSEWEDRNVTIEDGDIVLINFGWARTRWGLGEAGFAHLESWPGLSRDGAEHLRDRGVRAVGTDCVSLDSGDGGRGELPAHFVLLTEGILILENVANIEELPPLSYFLALPLKIADGTGSPLRAMALCDPE